MQALDGTALDAARFEAEGSAVVAAVARLEQDFDAFIRLAARIPAAAR